MLFVSPLQRLRVLQRSTVNRKLSDFVRVVEVGPRDGLQNEKTVVPTSTKISLINRLSSTGLKTIESTSFVSPKWVPQMGDSSEVFTSITKAPGVSYPVLVPNLKGLDAAISSGVKEIAVFGAASNTFSMKNINCSIEESLIRFQEVAKAALKAGIRVRGYVSCIAGCPYEGEVKPSVVARVSESMLEAGCYEISLGDTIGTGTPRIITNVLNEVKTIFSRDLTLFALHCHNTYGQALANIFTGLTLGVRVFDSSVGGLGGCPYAAGASGNVPTEDLLYLLQGEGLQTGVDFEKIVEIGEWISKQLGRDNQSKVGVALASRRR
ncbi:hydroxymethylglutaryl-CoA lyase, mitochondrial isoform X2 [Fopius arisanus]|nr:PREDICTED: hydroxymethylglutaryl-CoA lyase, mitochondrial isoform X2 [Fopius arisanus]